VRAAARAGAGLDSPIGARTFHAGDRGFESRWGIHRYLIDSPRPARAPRRQEAAGVWAAISNQISVVTADGDAQPVSAPYLR
jgi:hypothetical protein